MFRFLLLFLFLGGNLLAQEPCGYIATPQDQEKSRSFQAEFRDLTRGWTRSVIDIPVKFHIIRKNDGTGGVSETLLEEAIQGLNDIYLSANLRFVQYDAPNYINSSRYYYFRKGDEEALANTHEVPDVMNVFCVGDMPYCGYAYFPGTAASNRVFMNNRCFANQSTFPHEVGHFFGLYHTHGKTNDGNTDERVNRFLDLDNNKVLDCEETGDECCDTPADPNLKKYPAFCTQDCFLTLFELKDTDGEFFSPLIDNLMSYNPYKTCRKSLTEDQIARIEVVAQNERSNLKRPENVVVATKRASARASVVFTRETGSNMDVTLDRHLYRFDEKYRSGDGFTFEARQNSEIPLHLYIINMDARGKLNKVYPYYPSESTLQLSGSTYQPDGTIVLDNNKGKEYVALLYARETLDIDAVTRQLQRAPGTFTQRLYDVLGSRLLLQDQVTYSQDIIQFEGELEPHQIIPIMLEMDHQ